MRRALRLLAGFVSLLIWGLVLIGWVVISGPPPRGPWQGAVALVCGALLYSVPVAIVIHEGGHFLAGRLLGMRTAAVYLGSPPALMTLHLGQVLLGLGLRPTGKVVWKGWPAPGRLAVSVAAGPLANLVTAPVLLVTPVPHWIAFSFALISGSIAAGTLFPGKSRSGQPTDGARLLQAPARSRACADLRHLLEQPDWPTRADAAGRLLKGYQLQVEAARNRFHTLAHLLRNAGWIEDLLDIHASAVTFLPGAPGLNTLMAVHHLEWDVLNVPGLPQAAADLAARRVEWVIRHNTRPQDDMLPAFAVEHTLALARLRQGRPAEVEPLCAAGLAADLQPSQRATVLATVALARQALGQHAGNPLNQALALDPAADLVSEAASVIPVS
jgi:hypothetical protein